MKIVYEDPHQEPDDLATSIASSIKQTGYHSGNVESAREIADQSADAVGKLIDMLAAKGVLSTDEAAGFLDYRWSSEAFAIVP